MKKIEIEELKRLQIEILNAVHDSCIKNNIDYWLDSGTLLGAIRHKGYIPWDDDIDIGMLRSAYESFVKYLTWKMKDISLYVRKIMTNIVMPMGRF